MKLWVAESVIARMVAEARATAPLETGGVLLGWRDGDDRIAVDLIGAGPKALHGRHMFLPDHPWQTQKIREAFAATSGDLDYLGDWHTHPDGVAELSGMDRKTLGKMVRKMRGATMLIAAGSDHDWSVGAWTAPYSPPFSAPRPVSYTIAAFAPPLSWPRAPDNGAG